MDFKAPDRDVDKDVDVKVDKAFVARQGGGLVGEERDGGFGAGGAVRVPAHAHVLVNILAERGFVFCVARAVSVKRDVGRVVNFVVHCLCSSDGNVLAGQACANHTTDDEPTTGSVDHWAVPVCGLKVVIKVAEK